MHAPVIHTLQLPLGLLKPKLGVRFKDTVGGEESQGRMDQPSPWGVCRPKGANPVQIYCQAWLQSPEGHRG